MMQLRDLWMREVIFDMLHVIKPVNLSIEFTLESSRINFTFIIEWYEIRGNSDCLFYLKYYAKFNFFIILSSSL